jgi:hypothetical protein
MMRHEGEERASGSLLFRDAAPQTPPVQDRSCAAAAVPGGSPASVVKVAEVSEESVAGSLASALLDATKAFSKLGRSWGFLTRSSLSLEESAHLHLAAAKALVTGTDARCARAPSACFLVGCAILTARAKHNETLLDDATLEGLLRPLRGWLCTPMDGVITSAFYSQSEEARVWLRSLVQVHDPTMDATRGDPRYACVLASQHLLAACVLRAGCMRSATHAAYQRDQPHPGSVFYKQRTELGALAFVASSAASMDQVIANLGRPDVWATCAAVATCSGTRLVLPMLGFADVMLGRVTPFVTAFLQTVLTSRFRDQQARVMGVALTMAGRALREYQADVSTCFVRASITAAILALSRTVTTEGWQACSMDSNAYRLIEGAGSVLDAAPAGSAASAALQTPVVCQGLSVCLRHVEGLTPSPAATQFLEALVCALKARSAWCRPTRDVALSEQQAPTATGVVAAYDVPACLAVTRLLSRWRPLPKACPPGDDVNAGASEVINVWHDRYAVACLDLLRQLDWFSAWVTEPGYLFKAHVAAELMSPHAPDAVFRAVVVMLCRALGGTCLDPVDDDGSGPQSVVDVLMKHGVLQAALASLAEHKGRWLEALWLLRVAMKQDPSVVEYARMTLLAHVTVLDVLYSMAARGMEDVPPQCCPVALECLHELLGGVATPVSLVRQCGPSWAPDRLRSMLRTLSIAVPEHHVATVERVLEEASPQSGRGVKRRRD